MTKNKSEIETLKEIRLAGSLKDIDLVIKILRNTTNPLIKKEATSLLADVKNDAIIAILVDALRTRENNQIRKEIIQACWESGLDYSSHLPYFVDLFLTLDFEESIEAFTLIENTYLDFNPPEEFKPALTQKIKTFAVDLPEHKQNLALELLNLLRD